MEHHWPLIGFGNPTFHGGSYGVAQPTQPKNWIRFDLIEPFLTWLIGFEVWAGFCNLHCKENPLVAWSDWLTARNWNRSEQFNSTLRPTFVTTTALLLLLFLFVRIVVAFWMDAPTVKWLHDRWPKSPQVLKHFRWRGGGGGGGE